MSTLAATTIVLISQRATTVTSSAKRTYSLWSFFFFIPEVISVVTYPIAKNVFTDTRVMTLGCQRRSWISKFLLTYFTGCKRPLKMHFHVFFTGWLHVFDRCAKTVCARWNPKQDELSFIRYNTDYCGSSSSPDHRVRKLIEFLKRVFSFYL